jgi:nitrite reductase/ring-hydroxylating ferredoxin subunit/hemoglobin-like flavoprotein
VTTLDTAHQQEVASAGAEDAGRYFRYMADYVGFTDADAAAIRQTQPIIEKHLPAIVSKFYAHLLRYGPTRKYFLHADGTLNQEYLELRMRHLTNFWLRTAEGVYDDDYARYVDYVGRAHTARGADPNIYIAERYVIGQVGMMQHAISAAINQELSAAGSSVEFPAAEAWDKLMMVILELLARAYGDERAPERFEPQQAVDQEFIGDLAERAVAQEQGAGPAVPVRTVTVATAAEIPPGARKIVQVGNLSIGVFHHGDEWFAVRNSCVHRGGPVATGTLLGDVLTCPWHGFQFNLRTAQCLADPKAKLDRYGVAVVDGQVCLEVPDPAAGGITAPLSPATAGSIAPTNGTPGGAPVLAANQFLVTDIPPGRMRLLTVDGVDVTVYNVGGTLYAAEDACTHAGGPLHEGELKDNIVTCPWHFSCFDVQTGAPTCPPATAPLRTYPVTVDGPIGIVGAAR